MNNIHIYFDIVEMLNHPVSCGKQMRYLINNHENEGIMGELLSDAHLTENSYNSNE